MKKPKIIINTSSWINVYNAGLIDHLLSNFQVFVTPRVREEILSGKDFAEDSSVFEKAVSSGLIKVITPREIPKEIKHELSISSGEIEIIACAIEDKDCVVLIDDAKTYRIMDRLGIRYISSAHVVIDAYMSGVITKDDALAALERLRKALRDDVIDKAIEVLEGEFEVE